MIGAGIEYVAHGSKGDLPDLAKVVLSGGLSTSQSTVTNLHLDFAATLEPG